MIRTLPNQASSRFRLNRATLLRNYRILEVCVSAQVGTVLSQQFRLEREILLPDFPKLFPLGKGYLFSLSLMTPITCVESLQNYIPPVDLFSHVIFQIQRSVISKRNSFCKSWLLSLIIKKKQFFFFIIVFTVSSILSHLSLLPCPLVSHSKEPRMSCL